MKGPSSADRENEIKLAVPSAAAARRLLRRAGFRVLQPRVFESNIVFDTPVRDMLHSGRLLRIREVNGSGLLTYKGSAIPGRRHKCREEIETPVDDPQAARRILERLGFQPAFRYEKYRTEFTRAGRSGVAVIDEIPIGVYIELEGPPRWIDRTARELGFSPSDYITSSYGRLYREFCNAQGRKPGDMVYKTSTSQPSPGLSDGRI
jgi:adenylate cyclase class 2